MRPLLIAAVFAALAAPAQAADVVRVPLGNAIGELVASPDGGAWVTIVDAQRDESIGRAQPDGTFRTVPAPSTLFGGILGPDGRAWFTSGLDVLRVDTALAISPRGGVDAGPGRAPPGAGPGRLI
jgi:streptogramin lyase